MTGMEKSTGAAVVRVLLEALAIAAVAFLTFIMAIFGLAKKS